MAFDPSAGFVDPAETVPATGYDRKLSGAVLFGLFLLATCPACN